MSAVSIGQRLVESLGEHDLLAALQGRQPLQVAVQVDEITRAGQGHVPEPERLGREVGDDPGALHLSLSLVGDHGRAQLRWCRTGVATAAGTPS